MPPTRQKAKEEIRDRENEGGRYKELVDLDYLPQIYIDRIDSIFDSYFNLGMKNRLGNMEQGAPVFPNGVSSLSSSDLGDILGEYTAWFSYASDKHKYVVVAENHIYKEMQRVLDLGVANLLLEKGNIEAKKAKARSSDEYVAMVVYHQKLEGLKILLDRELSTFEKCIASLSREVARRENNGGF